MTKSPIEWKIRGYPYIVNYNCNNSKDGDILDWFDENLDSNAWVRINHYQIVFSNQESAALFQLTFSYE